MDFGYDTTNGVIIGGDHTRVEFWQKHPQFEWQEKVACQYFVWGTSDSQMIAWFAENHPDQYARRQKDPIEMRVFDQPGKREQAMIDARSGKPENA